MIEPSVRGAFISDKPDEPRYTAPEPKRKRDWSSIFQKTFDRINQTFSAAEDEEI